MSRPRAQNAGEMTLTQGKYMSRTAVVAVARTHVVLRLVPNRKIEAREKRDASKEHAAESKADVTP
jgi:hypothetical protein